MLQQAIQNNSLLSPKQVSEMIGIAEQTLAIWRCTKRYPLPYIKCGRYVRYKYNDVQKFLDERMVVVEEY